MILAASGSSRKTHYDVLQVEEDATYDEIRASYKAAVLNYHPDKLQRNANTFDAEYKFLQVQRAWEVLSDSKTRSNYDKELRASRQEMFLAADEIRLEEMSVEDFDKSKEFFYQCRCGDCFSTSVADLESMGISLDGSGRVKRLNSTADTMPASILLSCGSCSLKIRLIIEVDY